ncbi:NAD(P)H-dependent FMN reductase [Catenulispora sp. GAS73]
MGLEPLQLVPCLLTIAVFDAHVFEEGIVIRGAGRTGINGLPLAEHEIRELMATAQVPPSAAALLHLALEHQGLLLAAPEHDRGGTSRF